MGSYCNLKIEDYIIHDCKNGVDDLCTTPFTEADRIFERRQSNRIILEEYSEEELEDAVFEYESTVRDVIDRLEIIGFTMENARLAFEKGLSTFLDSRVDYHWSAREKLSNMELSANEREWYLQTSNECETEFCATYTFEAWTASAYNLIESISKLDSEFTREFTKCLPIENEITGSFFLGFPNANPYHALRAILESFNKDDYLVLDYADLVYGGWIDPHEELCNVEPRIVILTEGPTDIDILALSLYALYPHLYDYYSFMDFRTLNVPANAAALANIVKSFIGAKIKERMIAIFDNDAAASDVLRSLPVNSLPENIKVIQLPNLEIATLYPTIGPQGIHLTDVNGCACSIEMYLGRDILTDDSGELIPVRWGAYLNGVKRYQGELEQKKIIQQRYNDLLKNIDYATQVPDHDWSGLELVFQSIFKAFK